MIVLTIAQLLEMSDGGTPEAFKGKIKKVFTPTRNKPDSDKTWKMQKCILADVGGSKEIEVVFKDRDDLPRTLEGQIAYIVAGRGERGLKGLSRKDNTWKDKTTPQVWVYDSADFSIEGAAPAAPAAHTGAQPPPVAQPPAAAQTAPAANGNGHGHTNGNGEARAAEMKLFDKRIAKTSAALNRCFDAAFALIASVNSRHGSVAKIEPTAELIEKIAMGMMVNACWTAKPAEIEAFPLKPFQSYDTPAPGAPFQS
jgi:hypothetical protein